MPVYNGEPYLKEALDSVLSQSYTNFELILINDGSTDNTQQIINDYHDNRIFCVNQKNLGVARSLNIGLSIATGDYIWRHDADDKSLPEKLEEQVNFLNNHPDIALCSTQIAFMTSRGKIARNCLQPKAEFFKGIDYFRLVDAKDFNPFSPITHATVLVRTKVLRKLKGFRPDFKTAEDVDLWLRLLDNHKAAVLQYCNYFVRINSASVTVTHGWKNAYYRELAKKYHLQRQKGGVDDLEKSGYIPEGYTTTDSINGPAVGKLFRSDLLNFQYKINLNAKDWIGVYHIWYNSIRDGWMLSKTWKALLFPVLGSKLVGFGVRIKQFFR